ncbi:Ferredoxin [Durusdinium trenchii]|uniref:Ferredoxin n=1 Tax=Durusdinium trenchii TaxID=1381693 RepID=A0ABP0QMB0_9DINO
MPSAELLATLADMPAKEYLKHFCLDYYLSEALQCDSTDKLQDFWQDVLDGSHLKSKAYDFKRVMATAENRRSFVELLRTRLKLVTSKPEVLAVTVLDFYDMLVLLLPDFPLDLLVDAADLAMPVVDRRGGGREMARGPLHQFLWNV